MRGSLAAVYFGPRRGLNSAWTSRPRYNTSLFIFICDVLVALYLVRRIGTSRPSPNMRIGLVRSSPRNTCDQHTTPFSISRAARSTCLRRTGRSHKVSPNRKRHNELRTNCTTGLPHPQRTQLHISTTSGNAISRTRSKGERTEVLLHFQLSQDIRTRSNQSERSAVDRFLQSSLELARYFRVSTDMCAWSSANTSTIRNHFRRFVDASIRAIIHRLHGTSDHRYNEGEPSS
jgi:hypothetical protein